MTGLLVMSGDSAGLVLKQQQSVWGMSGDLVIVRVVVVGQQQLKCQVPEPSDSDDDQKAKWH